MKTLFRFTGEQPAKPWAETNDGVMGGRSSGRARLLEDGMLFSGSLSLENNGGFSSVYTSGRFDLSEYDGLRLRVLGDGRSYELRLNSDAMYRGYSPVAFRRAFDTVEGEWIEVFVPFSDLKQSWRGRELSGYRFNAAQVRRIGLMLVDKQAGPFALKVHWLAADSDD